MKIKQYSNSLFFLMIFSLSISTLGFAQKSKLPRAEFISNDFIPGFGSLTPEFFIGRQISAAVIIGLSSEINVSKKFRVYGSARQSIGEIENSLNDNGSVHTSAGDLGFTFNFFAKPIKATIKVPVSVTQRQLINSSQRVYFVRYAVVEDKKMLKLGLRGGILGNTGSKYLDGGEIYYIDSLTKKKETPSFIRSRTLGVYSGIELSLTHNVLVMFEGSELRGGAIHSFFADVVYGVHMSYWDIGWNPQILYNSDNGIRKMGFRVGYIYHSDPKYNFNLYMKSEFGNLPGIRANQGDCFYILFSMGKDLSIKNKAK